MNIISKHISIKLFLSYLLVMLVAMAVIFFSVMFTAPGAYSRHMQMTANGMMVDGTALPGMMGRGQGRGPGFAQGIGFDNFRAGMLDSLGYALIVAVVVAVLVSLVLSRRIVAPVRAMMCASQRIADGRYDERVLVSSSDELGQLAQYFNRMAERLEQTESMRRQLLGDVSHELRTPLTAIGGYMEGLVDGVLPANAETFDQVRMEATRLSRLVDDLQELSRVEAGAYRLEKTAVDISALMRTVEKRLGHAFTDKGVQLEVQPPQKASSLLVDEDRIIQVLTNLLGNALAYTPRGGLVRLSAVQKEQEVEFSVRDNGIGIPPESLAHIFDRFYRVDKSRSRAAGGGSGIGLTIARAFVEAHGGRIWAVSAGEGQGSTFFFSLPLAA